MLNNMENYEKKYRHAIEVVKKYSGAHIMLTEDLIGEMFPELIENNDEKIRTELIRLISDWSDDGRASTCGYLTSIPKKDILDWLERQKSLFSDNEKRDVLEYIEKFKENYGHYPKDADEIGVIVSEMVNKHNKPIVFESKDQGRYEDIRDILRELINNDKYTRSAIECDLKWLTERFRYMKPQPKQEWSERDELMLGKCIDAASGYYSPEDKQSMKDWLNSLKDRVQPQPKQEWNKRQVVNALTSMLTEKIKPLTEKVSDGTINDREEMFRAALIEIRSFVNSPSFQIGKEDSIEWSEEDEKIIKETESWLNTLCYYLDTSPEYITDIKDVINKLKSLRLQKQWKPSEKQINALSDVLSLKDIKYDVLSGLLECLKRLK